MSNCHHDLMYFENGRLTCERCDKDCTPPQGVRIAVVISGYRDNIIQHLQEIANEVPDNILHEIEIYAEYLNEKNKKSDAFAKVINMVGNSSGQYRGKNRKNRKENTK